MLKIWTLCCGYLLVAAGITFFQPNASMRHLSASYHLGFRMAYWLCAFQKPCNVRLSPNVPNRALVFTSFVLCDLCAICEVGRSQSLSPADFEVKCARYFKSMLSPLYQARHVWKSLAQDSNIKCRSNGALGESAAEKELDVPLV